MTDSTDPIPALKSDLTEILRQALNEAHAAHITAYQEGTKQLSSNPIWQRLNTEQQETILHEVGIVVPAKPDTASDSTILAALEGRNLVTRKAEADAVSGRVANALKGAAILLEPKVKPVSIEKSLLKTADEVRQWAERQQKTLLDAVEKGPVQVQYPPLRGKFLQTSSKRFCLYTRGSVPFFETYPGLYVPRPIEVATAAGEETPLSIAKEILGLTKMNWNSTQFDGSMPLTITAASGVGKVLKHCSQGQRIEPRYSFYM